LYSERPRCPAHAAVFIPRRFYTTPFLYHVIFIPTNTVEMIQWNFFFTIVGPIGCTIVPQRSILTLRPSHKKNITDWEAF